MYTSKPLCNTIYTAVSFSGIKGGMGRTVIVANKEESSGCSLLVCKHTKAEQINSNLYALFKPTLLLGKFQNFSSRSQLHWPVVCMPAKKAYASLHLPDSAAYHAYTLQLGQAPNNKDKNRILYTYAQSACFRPSFSVYTHKSNNIVFVLKIDRSIQSSIFMNANNIMDGAIDRSYILLQQKYCAHIWMMGPGKESLCKEINAYMDNTQ